MSKTICVIIPTYNRLDVLKQTLRALTTQTVKPSKVVIVDDGSPRQVIEALKSYIKKIPLPIYLLENAPQKGPAAARNKGILKTKEDFILFINDDTVPMSKDFISYHLSLAQRFPDCSIMGPFGGESKTTSDFLYGKWVRKLGVEVPHLIEEGQILDFPFFCTANIFIPRRLLTNCLFDENFPYPAHEDTELGYRLSQKGFLLRFNPRSAVKHLHEYTPEMLINRQKKVGESVAYLLEKYPELDYIFKPKLSKFICRLVGWLAKIPLSRLLPDDFRLFLLGLVAKYNSFYSYQ